METMESELTFDEKKSLQVMKAAIATARRTLLDDGILLMIWGVAFSVSNLWRFYESAVLTAWWMRNLMSVVHWGLGIGAIVLTVWFLFLRKRKVTTYTAISTRFVWIGVIIAHNFVIVITKSILKEVDFNLLHPLQMVLIGFALFVTGGIYRYYLLSFSGVLMWIAAAIAVRFDLNFQFLVRGIAEIFCFIVPGVLMISARKKVKRYVQ